MDEQWLHDAVALSLQEDIGSGDITSALINKDVVADARVFTRESMLVCGIPFFNKVFSMIDDNLQINWHVDEADRVIPNQPLVSLSGKARSLLTGERCALNWLQFLSGIATNVVNCLELLKGTKTVLLDTRKTLPGLRYAQKYAVRVGGGRNHRMGLYDAYLIKENHIVSCGSIKNAIKRSRHLYSDKIVEVEVENMDELEEALSANADIIMLDNFNLEQMRESVALTKSRAKLEVSGNVDLNGLRDIAETGVDFISMGALTKHVHAIDLSMHFLSSFYR